MTLTLCGVLFLCEAFMLYDETLPNVFPQVNYMGKWFAFREKALVCLKEEW